MSLGYITGKRGCQEVFIKQALFLVYSQPPHDLQEPIKMHGALHTQVLLPEHHVVAVIFSSKMLPLAADRNLLAGFGIFQMIPLRLYHEDHPTDGHGNDVGISVHITVDDETPARYVAVPPEDIRHVGQFPGHVAL